MRTLVRMKGRPTTVAAAKPGRPDSPARPKNPALSGRGLKHRDYAFSEQRLKKRRDAACTLNRN